MPTWTATPDNGQPKTGNADTLAEAWAAVHDAAIDLVNEGTLTRMVLNVDGLQSTVHPGNSGSHAADTAAMIDTIMSGRDVLVSAYQARGE